MGSMLNMQRNVVQITADRSFKNQSNPIKCNAVMKYSVLVLVSTEMLMYNKAYIHIVQQLQYVQNITSVNYLMGFFSLHI